MKWLALCVLSACASTAAPPASQPVDTRPIGDIWHARCGNCHERIQPGEHTREFLTDALKRHRKRVRLNEEQWQAMIDFLARP
jgi:hypothetical protein